MICRRPNWSFIIYISRHEKVILGRLDYFKSMHTFIWNYHSKTLNSIIIAKRYVNQIKINPQIKCNDFRREMIDDLKLHISKVQAKKAWLIN